MQLRVVEGGYRDAISQSCSDKTKDYVMLDKDIRQCVVMHSRHLVRHLGGHIIPPQYLLAPPKLYTMINHDIRDMICYVSTTAAYNTCRNMYIHST